MEIDRMTSMNPDAGKTVCGVKCSKDLIIVADYGQPNVTKSGIWIPEGRSDEMFYAYRFDLWRYGEVIAIGPGRVDQRGRFHEPPNVRIGDVILFSRKHGTKVGHYYDHPKHGSLLFRFLDQEKAQATIPGFEPWWDAKDTQVHPAHQFSG